MTVVVSMDERHCGSALATRTRACTRRRCGVVRQPCGLPHDGSPCTRTQRPVLHGRRAAMDLREVRLRGCVVAHTRRQLGGRRRCRHGRRRDARPARRALLRGYDAYDGTGDTADVTGHGTAVASLIAARTNDARGMAGACGRCSILPVRGTAPDGSAPVSAIAAGHVWAADHGARVINVSLVVTTVSPVLAAAVTHAHDRGALVVAAAGNESRRGPDYPAGIAGVVSVEASTRSGAAYDFSNYGRQIAVAAPGCAVVAERAGGHTSQCGTSVAAPLVAGAAALVASVTPNATADT